MKKIGYRHFSTARRFGVELEISNNMSKEHVRDIVEIYSPRRTKLTKWGQSRDNDCWHIKPDASCGILGFPYDTGLEVASFVGTGIEDIQHMAYIADRLADFGSEVNEKCGLHVHVEVADFSQEQMGVLLGHWTRVEWLVLAALPVQRQDCAYCEPFCKYLSYPQDYCEPRPLELWEELRPTNLDPHDNKFRLRSINLVNYAYGLLHKSYKRKTVEFRLPEGTLVGYEVENWIKFFVNFVEWVRWQPMPATIRRFSDIKDCLDHMGIGHEDDFYIYDKELRDTRTWFLERLMDYGPGWVHKAAKATLNQMWAPERRYY